MTSARESEEATKHKRNSELFNLAKNNFEHKNTAAAIQSLSEGAKASCHENAKHPTFGHGCNAGHYAVIHGDLTLFEAIIQCDTGFNAERTPTNYIESAASPIEIARQLHWNKPEWERLILIYQLRQELSHYTEEWWIDNRTNAESLRDELTYNLSLDAIYKKLSNRNSAQTQHRDLYNQIVRDYMVRIETLTHKTSSTFDEIVLSDSQKQQYLKAVIKYRHESPANLAIIAKLSSVQTCDIVDAAKLGKWEMVTALASNASPPFQHKMYRYGSALLRAARANNGDAAMALLNAGAREKESGLLSEPHRFDDEKTALYHAAEHKNVELFTALVASGADPQYRSWPHSDDDKIPFKKAKTYTADVVEDEKENPWNSIVWLCQLQNELNDYADSWTARHSDRARNLIQNLYKEINPGETHTERLKTLLERAQNAFKEDVPVLTTEKYGQKSINGIKDRYNDIINKYATYLEKGHNISKEKPQPLKTINPTSLLSFFRKGSQICADKKSHNMLSKRVSL